MPCCRVRWWGWVKWQLEPYPPDGLSISFCLSPSKLSDLLAQQTINYCSLLAPTQELRWLQLFLSGHDCMNPYCGLISWHFFGRTVTCRAHAWLIISLHPGAHTPTSLRYRVQHIYISSRSNCSGFSLPGIQWKKRNQFPNGPVATRLSGPKQPASTGFMV